MGFNRRKMEDRRRQAAEKEGAARRATEAQVLEDAGRLVAAWNERQAKRMPTLFSRTIGCALKARHCFLWVCCPACRTTQAVDLRTLDRHPWSSISSLIPALSCSSCRPHAPFDELVRLSDNGVADELRKPTTRQALGDQAINADAIGPEPPCRWRSRLGVTTLQLGGYGVLACVTALQRGVTALQ